MNTRVWMAVPAIVMLTGGIVMLIGGILYFGASRGKETSFGEEANRVSQEGSLISTALDGPEAEKEEGLSSSLLSDDFSIHPLGLADAHHEASMANPPAPTEKRVLATTTTIEEHTRLTAREQEDIEKWFTRFQGVKRIDIAQKEQELFDDARSALVEGRLEDAADLLEELLSREPDLGEAYALLGSTLASLGKHQQAAQYYQRFLELAPDHRQAADVMRILEEYDSFIEKNPDVSPPDVSPSGVLSSYDMHGIQLVFARLNGTLFPCIREEVRRSGFSGTISFSFVIENDGRVGNVWLDNENLRDGLIHECFEEMMASWRFPPFEGERPTVNHSFTVGSR